MNISDWDNVKECVEMLILSLGNYDFAKLLIENKANVNAANKDNYTALIHAALTGKWMRNKKKFNGLEIIKIFCLGNVNIMKLLIQNGANIDAMDIYNNTALILAIDHSIIE